MHYSTMEWTFHGLVFSLNLILFLAAKPIVTWASGGTENLIKMNIFRSINILLLVLHALDILLIGTYPEYQHYFVRIAISLTLVYLSLLLFGFLVQWARRRFGVRRESDGVVTYYDSYSSRIVEIFMLSIAIFLVVYCLIKIWNADSLLETTGILGILAAFLAFTSSIWAPDIISGLLILNSKMLDDGDVVVVDGYPEEFIINRVSFMYTTLFSIRDNRRTLIRNHRFTKAKIDNYSKLSSIDGIRKALVYQIGYPKLTCESEEARLAEHKAFQKRVDAMFQTASELCGREADIKINTERPFEWNMTRAGDYALEYTLWFYLERLHNTKSTSTARRHLINSVYRLNELVYTTSVIKGLELATPDLVEVNVTNQKLAASDGIKESRFD